MYDISVTSDTLRLYPELLPCRAPMAALSYSPLPHQIYVPQKKQRIIWRTSDITPQEKDLIGPMKAHLEQHFSQDDFALIPRWSDINVLQYVQQTNNKPKEAVAMLQAHFEWLRQPYFRFDSLTPLQQDIIRRGAIYSFGRDNRFRPVVIMDISKMIEELKKGRGDDLMVTCFFLFQCVKLVMMLPAKVEQVVCLLSFTGLSMTSIPIRFIADLIAQLNKHFIHLADTIFIYDAPRFVLFSWALIKKCFNKETNERIQFATPSNGLLLKTIDSHQLETRYGGTATLQNFYPFPSATPQAPLIDIINTQPKNEVESLETVFYSFDEEKHPPVESGEKVVGGRQEIGGVDTGEPEYVQQAQCGLFSCGVESDKDGSQACRIL